jgi:hypothetical protein
MAKKKAPTKKKAPKVEKVVEEEVLPEKPKKTVYKKIKCNLWRTRLHAEELGIYQSLKYQAKTRWFSKKFDIEGLVEIDGEKKYIIAYNKDQFHEEKKRLTLRLFTILEEKMGAQKGGNFKGGIELSYTHSLVQSVEVKYAAPVFFTHLPGTPMMARIVRGHRWFRTRWSFPLLPEEKEDQLQLVINKGTIGFGNDYNVYLGDIPIGRVDHQRVTKDVEIEIYNEDLAKDKTFVMILTLFGCICFFMKDIRKEIKKFYKTLRDTGTTEFKPPKFELDLFKNPRMIRR